MPVIIGPDGFLCGENDRHAAHHLSLNDALRAQADDWRNDHAVALAAVQRIKKELTPEELVSLALAAFDRARWIEEHDTEIADAPSWKRRIATILFHLYALKLPFSAAGMGRLMRARRYRTISAPGAQARGRLNGLSSRSRRALASPRRNCVRKTY